MCSKKFTFVDDRDDNIITLSIMIFYSRKVPVRESVVKFIARVRQQVNKRIGLRENLRILKRIGILTKNELLPPQTI